MELEDKIFQFTFRLSMNEDGYYNATDCARDILAIPEIAEALEAAKHWSEGVKLPPETIEKMRLVYGSERKIRVTDD